MSRISRINTPDGLSWLVRQSGSSSSPPSVLIPSGEGDSFVFETLLSLLSPHFHLTTFDMPGFSHTTGSTALTSLSLRKIATQITYLMSYLRIPAAAFWGCSSGGLAALAILKFYPEGVRNIIIHEVPFGAPDFVYALKEQSDEAVVSSCRVLFKDAMVGDPEAWDALGEEYHERLGSLSISDRNEGNTNTK